MQIFDVDLDSRAVESHSAVTVEIHARNGTVGLASTVGLYLQEGSVMTNHMKWKASYRDANRALASVTYRGLPNYFGTDTIDFHVSDEGNLGDGGPIASRASFPIDVLFVEDPSTILVPPFPMTCAEADYCLVKGVSIIDPDFPAGATGSFTIAVEEGELFIRRSQYPTSIELVGLHEGAKKVKVRGILSHLNEVIGDSIFYHGSIGTHSSIDTIALSFLRDDMLSTPPNAEESLFVVILQKELNPPTISYIRMAYPEENNVTTLEQQSVAQPSAFDSASSPPITNFIHCTEDVQCYIAGITVDGSIANPNLLELNLEVSNGSVAIFNPHPQIHFLAGNETDLDFLHRQGLSQRRLTLRGGQTSINEGLANLVFLSSPDYNGRDAVVISVQDVEAEFGFALRDEMELIIDIASVVDLPRLRGGPTEIAEVYEDGFIAITGAEVFGGESSQIARLEIRVEHGSILRDGVILAVNSTLHGPAKPFSTIGNSEELSKTISFLTFAPEKNWNSEGRDFAHIRLKLSDTESLAEFDKLEIHIRVIPVNDLPVVAFQHETVPIQIDEDNAVVLHALLVDVDDDNIEVILHSTAGDISLFNRTDSCFDCEDLDDVVIYERSSQRLALQGTVEALNNKLGAIKYLPHLDYHGDGGGLSIYARDSKGGEGSTQMDIIVAPRQDPFELWMPVRSGTATPPGLVLDEGNRIKIGAEWFPLTFSEMRVRESSPSLMNSLLEALPVPVPGSIRELDRPRAFSIVDKESRDALFCVDLRVGFGSLTIDDDASAAEIGQLVLEEEGERVLLSGNVAEVNFAARHIIYSADPGDSGATKLNVTVCERSWCGPVLGLDSDGAPFALSDEPSSRGCAHASIALFIRSVNSAPTLRVIGPEGNPQVHPYVAEAAVNAPETAILSLLVGDIDLEDGAGSVSESASGGDAVLSVSLSVSAGTISLHALDGLSFVVGTGVSNGRMEFLGSLANLNRALCTMYYGCRTELGCGAIGEGGAELLSVLVDDNGFKGRGGPLQANITVSIRLLEEGFKHD